MNYMPTINYPKWNAPPPLPPKRGPWGWLSGFGINGPNQNWGHLPGRDLFGHMTPQAQAIQQFQQNMSNPQVVRPPMPVKPMAMRPPMIPAVQPNTQGMHDAAYWRNFYGNQLMTRGNRGRAGKGY